MLLDIQIVLVTAGFAVLYLGERSSRGKRVSTIPSYFTRDSNWIEFDAR